MTWLHIEPQFEPAFSALGLRSCEDIVQHFTRSAELRGDVFVTPAKLGESVDVFFKLYRARPSWRFIGRNSKARCEYENYAHLRFFGVPVAQRIAAGEQRDAFGRVKLALIITQAAAGARTLVDFVRERPRRAERQRLLRDLAHSTRAMHRAGFFHHDLVWRNLLVSGSGELIFIDCPRGAFARVGKARKQLRDLASLDKSAWQFCRRAERLRFLLSYLQKPRADDEVRSLVRSCLDYRRTRWPEDWQGK
jgi:tRNA A-37 threonylcarbamoyl transferase component Bud32